MSARTCATTSTAATARSRTRTRGLAWVVRLAATLATVHPAAAAPPPTAKAHPAKAKAKATAKGNKPAVAAFVALEDVAPGVVQELRYANGDNFTGAAVPGYGASKCWLTLPAARALARAQKELEAFGLGLKVFDCYRPQRAVAHFLAWSQNEAIAGQGARPDYLPRVARKDVFRLGYLAAKSGHSRGITVDVTLVPAGSPANPPGPRGEPCNLAAKGPLRNGELDMGTGYDCLDPTAHTENPNLPPQARANRMLLAAVMQRAGLVGYHLEWWHFTLVGAGKNPPSYDVPIR